MAERTVPCAMCDGGYVTYDDEYPEEGCWPAAPREENRIMREALEELAANRHSFHRPAGQIAREALDAAASTRTGERP